VPAGAAWL